MIEKVESYVLEHNMIQFGDKILIALSGGPDSVCMMHMLVSLRNKYNLDLYAAHINHMMRGNESDKDEEYVRQICDQYKIKLFVKRVDINDIVLKEKISSELAGRRERYKFFEDIYIKENINKIAVAHNANDQAETILMRIMRGSGLEGVSGIRPVRDNKFIRPILCLSREEVESYCDINHLTPRIDKTNLETVYNRNKIRHDILPYMKEHFNKDIVNTINRFGLVASIDNDFIEGEADNAMKKYYKLNDKAGIIASDLFKEHEAIICRVIRRALTDVSGESKNFEMKHIYSIIKLHDNQTGKVIELPNNVTALNVYGDIKLDVNNKGIGISSDINKCNKIYIDKKSINNVINFNFDKYSINMEIIDNKNLNIKNNSLIKYFDCDKINNITIRYRENGDRIVPFGMKSTKKLKDILINLKVPKEERDSIPIIQFDNDIGWVVGIKISDIFRINNDTKKVLRISVEERKHDEE